MRSLLKKNIINFIRFIPHKLRKYFLFILADSLKYKDGKLGREAILDFNVLENLKLDSYYLSIYYSSLYKAGDEKNDNVYKLLRHINLYTYIINIIEKGIEGDFAECGCFNGNSLFATKKILDDNNSKKAIHVFDSFEGGLSEFKKQDFEDSSIKSLDEAILVKEQFSSSFKMLSNKISESNNIFLNKGWIPSVLEKEKDRKYAFVHIDVDLFEPTYYSHKYFFERLSPGGIIVCDDYGYSQFPGAAKAVEKFISSISSHSYTHFLKHSFGTSVIIKK